MKKDVLLILVTAMLALVVGCTNSQGYYLEEMLQVETEEGAVKKIIDENSFIDFDISNLNDKFNKPTTQLDEEDKNEIALIKAAVYRFYSHVNVVEGKYVHSLNNPNQINMSERVFNFIDTDIEHLNSFVDEARKKGDEVVIVEIDDTYLNSLLK